LAVPDLDAAVEILQYHPEVAFHEEAGRLVFGPQNGEERGVMA
jgi:hypothetical protein